MNTFPILTLAKENKNFRKVIVTGPKSQVVLMSLLPGEEIGEEVHSDVDQTLVFVSGSGTAILEGQASPFSENDLVFVPAGTRHNFQNTGTEPVKLYTIYAPAEHPDSTIHTTKAEAEQNEHHS